MATLARSSDELERLADELRGLHAGDLSVDRARVESIIDSVGEAALRATLVVPEPAGDTWPVDMYFALRRSVNQIAVRLGFDEVVYVDLSAPSDIEELEEQADTDDDGDPETDAAVDAAITEQSTTDEPE